MMHPEACNGKLYTEHMRSHSRERSSGYHGVMGSESDSHQGHCRHTQGVPLPYRRNGWPLRMFIQTY